MEKESKQNETGSSRKTSESNRQIAVALLAQKHDDELISRRETAAWFGVCPHTIQRNQTLKPIRFNRRLVRYRVGDVRALIASATIRK